MLTLWICPRLFGQWLSAPAKLATFSDALRRAKLAFVVANKNLETDAACDAVKGRLPDWYGDLV
jgi:hypothetical protein